MYDKMASKVIKSFFGRREKPKKTTKKEEKKSVPTSLSKPDVPAAGLFSCCKKPKKTTKKEEKKSVPTSLSKPDVPAAGKDSGKKTPWWERLFGKPTRSVGKKNTNCLNGLFSCCKRKTRAAPVPPVAAEKPKAESKLPTEREAKKKETREKKEVPVVKGVNPTQTTEDSSSRSHVTQLPPSSQKSAVQLERIGFPNPRFNCYMNSSLQSLITMVDFIKHISSQEKVWSAASNAALIRSFMNIVRLRETVSLQSRLQVLGSFKDIVSAQASEFKDSAQKDAHEFLTTVMDQNRSLSTPLKNVAAELGSVYTCPVEGQMVFSMLNTRTCKSFGASTQRDEEFTNLSLDLVPGGSVQDMIQNYQKRKTRAAPVPPVAAEKPKAESKLPTEREAKKKETREKKEVPVVKGVNPTQTTEDSSSRSHVTQLPPSSQKSAVQLERIGFPNPRFNCYMNSSLQSLITMVDFIKHISSQEKVWSAASNAALIRSFMNIVRLRETVSLQSRLQVLGSFKDIVSAQASEFKDSAQKDAHEFLTTVMDQNRSLSTPLRNVAAGLGSVYTCPVEGQMVFSMLNTRTCKSFGASTQRDEEFTNLSLDLVPGGSVQDMIQNYQKRKTRAAPVPPVAAEKPKAESKLPTEREAKKKETREKKEVPVVKGVNPTQTTEDSSSRSHVTQLPPSSQKSAVQLERIGCGASTQRDEEFTNLSLDLVPGGSVQDMIQNYQKRKTRVARVPPVAAEKPKAESKLPTEREAKKKETREKKEVPVVKGGNPTQTKEDSSSRSHVTQLPPSSQKSAVQLERIGCGASAQRDEELPGGSVQDMIQNYQKRKTRVARVPPVAAEKPKAESKLPTEREAKKKETREKKEVPVVKGGNPKQTKEGASSRSHVTQLPPSSQKSAVQLERIGFPNPRFNCYMNSSLQSLITMVDFIKHISSQEKVWSAASNAALIRSFMNIVRLRKTVSLQSRLQVLGSFKDIVSAQASEFKDNAQKDAHEFLTTVMDQIRSLSTLLRNVAAGLGSVYTCPVEGQMVFSMLNTRKCKSCGASTQRDEEFTNLSLDLVPGGSVQYMLQNYQKETKLEFRCNCGGNISGQQSTFKTLPKVLILHVKRFGFTPYYEVMKLNDSVSLPRELRVTSSKGSAKYSLTSIISHLGSTPNSGHYISDGVHPDSAQGDPADRWMTYNDAKVTQTTGAKVCQQRKRTAYILFYKQQV